MHPETVLYVEEVIAYNKVRRSVSEEDRIGIEDNLDNLWAALEPQQQEFALSYLHYTKLPTGEHTHGLFQRFQPSFKQVV